MENNKKKEGNLFFSFIKHPNIRFETYEEGEEIILLFRSHPFTQIRWIFNSFLLFLLLIFLNLFLNQFLKFNQIFVLNIFYVIFVVTYIFIHIITWYFNVGILTNKRLIDIDFNGILYREITSARLNKIEDVTIKSGGYLSSFFDYGSIYVQTAGMENYIEFDDVPHPSFLVSYINKLISKKHE